MYQNKTFQDIEFVNIKAAELMGKLHDRLKEIGYEGHPLEVYLVRILFCLFAEDTTIFDKQLFEDFITQRTNEDGSDLASKLHEVFQVLNTSPDKRFKNIDVQLNKFPYVNGKLFEEVLPTASFDSKMRHALLECCYLDWSLISPAIFGSMFQAVMNKEERRNLGAHYTSEKNILKLIKPLFLDELREEFESIKGNRNKLIDFHKKLGNLKFLDPACGCGNFLVITYREMRLLEIDVLKILSKGEMFTDIKTVALLDVDQMYGIEIEEFPARVAEVAMWLIDHQMNQRLSQEFGVYFLRLPLQKSANILHANALQTDWASLIKPRVIETYFYDMGKREAAGKVDVIKVDYSYILGNPPFVGSKFLKDYQRDDMSLVFNKNKDTGVLDYVCAWYSKASHYIKGKNIKVAFVSTNSVTQGEQVSILWSALIKEYSIKIFFAHRTFSWSNEAKGKAAVHCVIIGFSNFDIPNKKLFEYEDIKAEPHKIVVKNINPYLVEAKDLLIYKRSEPLCSVPSMNFGNMPLDGGHLLLSDEEKNEFIQKEPKAKKYIKPLISAYEFLNGEKRWCLWFVDAEPSELRSMPLVIKRIELVKKFRMESVAPSTQKFAATPALFRDRNQPDTFIAVPRVSSENRKYIPMGFFDKNSIVGDTCLSIPNGKIFHFGILTSAMHMTWVKNTCGRLKSDFRYSKDIVYNNYPWPLNPTEKQIKAIETCSQRVLDIRLEFPNSSLADLYDPRTMPPKLDKAHQDLGKAVDAAYRSKPFESEAKRMEFLFELYEKYTADLFTKEKGKKRV
jgi:type I restriction-modification system DNA methylase subunit